MGYYQAIVNAVITVTASCRLPGDFSLGYITAQTSLQTVTDIRLMQSTHYVGRDWAGYSGKASIDQDQGTGLIYTENKPLGRLCKMCNPFFHEF